MNCVPYSPWRDKSRIPRGADGYARARRSRPSRSVGRPPRRGCLDGRALRRATLRCIGPDWCFRAVLTPSRQLARTLCLPRGQPFLTCVVRPRFVGGSAPRRVSHRDSRRGRRVAAGDRPAQPADSVPPARAPQSPEEERSGRQLCQMHN
jgi:hypothetical protein